MNTHRLFAAIIFGTLLLAANGGMTPAQALLAAHDCSFCHDFHGAISNAGLLKASSSETLCLSCHNVAINDTAAAAIHNPLNKASNVSGYITCRECHNPHDNVGGNVKLIGYKYDPQTGQRFVNPTIRVETTVSPPPYPTYKTVTFTGSTDFNKGNGTGACEICHSGNHHVGEDCTGCHGHADGFVASCSGCHESPPSTGAHLKHAGAGVGQYAYDCATCHPVDHDGTAADIAFTGIAATWAGATYSAAQKQCSNLYCHGSATADWDDGTGGACGDCHGAAGTGRPDGVGEPSGGSHLTASHQVACSTCHTHDGTDTAQHVNGPANANGDALVSAAGTSVDSYTYAGASHASSPDPDGYRYTGGTCANTCHSSQVWGGTMSCTSCHTGSGGGAKDVGPTSTHLKITVGGANQVCSACHPLHNGGVLVSNKSEVGISYTAGGRTGFRLGGSATTGTTEAEICWNCHDQNNDGDLADPGDVSEWGVNTGGTYNYGSYAGKSWFSGATWSSANFSYKNGALNSRPGAQARWSSHDTGSTVGTSTEQLHIAGVQNGVVCSYCHDVHDLNRATGDGTSGKPYLRGTWRPSGYREDGAPQSGQSWTTGTSVYQAGASTTTTVPRSSSAENGYGGYQIDQNNGNPNATYDYATNDGLCNLCHTQNSIQTAWVGHSNSVKGFANDTASARNIFSNAVTGRSTLNNRFNPGMAYQGVTNYYTKTWMGGFRETASGAGQGLTQPKVDGQAFGYLAASFQWGTQGTGLTNIDITGSSVNADYHSFSCSKCHTPHASRLPRLMITNCLDVKNNTWDNNTTFLNDPRWSNWPNLTPASGANGYHQLAYAKTAQNCHRYVDQNGNRAYDAATPFESPGWNTATPW